MNKRAGQALNKVVQYLCLSATRIIYSAFLPSTVCHCLVSEGMGGFHAKVQRRDFGSASGSVSIPSKTYLMTLDPAENRIGNIYIWYSSLLVNCDTTRHQMATISNCFTLNLYWERIILFNPYMT